MTPVSSRFRHSPQSVCGCLRAFVSHWPGGGYESFMSSYSIAPVFTVRMLRAISNFVMASASSGCSPILSWRAFNR